MVYERPYLLAIDVYIRKNTLQSSLTGFLNDDQKNKALLVQWFEVYTTLEQATSELVAMFLHAYNTVCPDSTTKKPNTLVDLGVLFAEAEMRKTIIKGNMGTIIASAHTTEIQKKQRLVDGEDIVQYIGNDTSLNRPNAITTDKAISDVASSSTAKVTSTVTPAERPHTGDYILANKFNMTKALKAYIEKCKKKKIEGMNYIELMASCNVVFLTQNACPVIMKDIGSSNLDMLKKELYDKYMNENIKVNDSLYMDLVSLFRDMDSEASQKENNQKIKALFKNSSEEDGVMCDVLIESLNKLPYCNAAHQLGELELCSRYFDPLLAPIFHDPEVGQQLVWIRGDTDYQLSEVHEEAEFLKKIACDMSQRTTLGLCRQKPTEQGDVVLADWNDRLYLANFTNGLVSTKDNKFAICVQTDGLQCSFYSLHEIAPGVTVMLDLLNFDVPQKRCEVVNLLPILDQLKRIYCLNKMKYAPLHSVSNPLEETAGTSIKEAAENETCELKRKRKIERV
ncbi:uncharacterized protein EV154DRAFT_502229 [Mucor mucedo]|uniref:uncharacterized protein n=1 Tax=Mucor mucedo TaxID=29922 RepID=UPI00221EA31F|nr:uncharacterized protein EV154DRAFT_502229 [Mucor mucedo]KAI7893258.1 hypothetical protein EV154DRAFT_502229 [Mucor mucedo]